MERIRLQADPPGSARPGLRADPPGSARPGPGRRRPIFASSSLSVKGEPKPHYGYATKVQPVPPPAVSDIRVLVKNNTSQKLQYKIESKWLSTGPTWPGAIAPWESKILDLRYLTSEKGYQYLTLGYDNKSIQVYEPSGKTKEVTILISEKVEIVFDVSFFAAFVS